MDLMRYLHIIERHIKEKLKAESVLIKIKCIDRKGNLYVTTKAKMNDSDYLKTSPLLLSNLLKSSPEDTSIYIEPLLYPVKDGLEYLRTQSAFKSKE